MSRPVLLLLSVMLLTCLWNISLVAQLPPATQKDNQPKVLRSVRNGNKYGFIKAAGETVVAPRFDGARDMHEGLAAVQVGKKWGYVDPTGQLVIPAVFDGIGDFSEGLAVSFQSKKRGYIDRSGQWVISQELGVNDAGFWSDLRNFKEGRARIQIGGLWGYIDTKGQVVIKPEYTSAEDFSEGLALVTKGPTGPETTVTGKNIGFIDTNGSIVIPFTKGHAASFSNGLAWFVRPSSILHGAVFIDHQGKEALKFAPSVDPHASFSESLVGIRDDDGWFAFADRTGKYKLYLDNLSSVGDFHEGIARMCELDGPQCGYVGVDGDVIVSPQFDSVEDFYGGLGGFVLHGRKGYVNRAGEIVSFEGDLHYDLPSCEMGTDRGSPSSFAERLHQAVARIVPLPGPEGVMAQVSPVVEQLRGLPLKQSPKLVVVSPDKFQETVRQRLIAVHDTAAWARRAKLLAALHIDVPGSTLADGLADGIRRIEAAVYIPETNTVYLQDGTLPFVQRLALASAVAQAIDAQQFDYQNRWLALRQDDDARFGLEAAFRGSSTIVLNGYLGSVSFTPKEVTPNLFSQNNTNATTKSAPLSPFIYASVLFPASYGARFVAGFRDARTYVPCPGELDRALKYPPKIGSSIFKPSSEYWANAKDQPSARQASLAPPGGGWTVLEGTHLGPVYAISVAVAAQSKQSEMDSGFAVNLTRDAFAEFAKGSSSVGVWLTIWNSTASADAFGRSAKSLVGDDANGAFVLVLGNAAAVVTGLPTEQAAVFARKTIERENK